MKKDFKKEYTNLEYTHKRLKERCEELELEVQRAYAYKDEIKFLREFLKESVLQNSNRFHDIFYEHMFPTKIKIP